MRTIETRIEVPVRPATAWAVLTDFAAHEKWNPFMRFVEGEPVVGDRLRVRLTPPGGRAMTFKPRVTAVEPCRRLEWLGSLGVRGLLDGRHAFELLDGGHGTTTMVHRETFGGLLVPLVWTSMAGPTRAGFDEFNAAFVRRCQDLARAAA